ncbi:MAG: Serine/threonine-protein kinase pkn3 [Myxococcaceae bacterium]|nr:Serine/threonine-protein kinase pkn3 [Myxococcaceae bacterium]
MELKDGSLIAGKYRIVKKLGEGAMGSVWLATNEATDGEFAIKVLRAEVTSAPDALARFFQEARVCGRLRHPSVVQIYDAGQSPELGGAPYLVMERLDGLPLDALIRQRGGLSPRLAVDIVTQVARGLHLAHQKGVVHRDVKPANVFLHKPGTGALVPKVLDFGISKMADPRTPEVSLTQTASFMGSPMYMSPEQMDSAKNVDARSDVHALGVLLWECLAGTSPFLATSYNMLVVEITRDARPDLAARVPGVSPALAQIVARAIAIDRKDRYPSASDLADALDQELAALGGEMLDSKTASAEVFAGLDMMSRPPPPNHASTTSPTSRDRPSAVSPAAQSVFGNPPFASTEAAPPPLPDPPVPAAAATAGPGQVTVTRTSRWLPIGLGVGAVFVAGALALIATVMPHGSGVSASVTIESTAPSPVPSAVQASADAGALLAAPASSTAASTVAVASSAPAATSSAKHVVSTHATSAKPSKPVVKIDQSGL